MKQWLHPLVIPFFEIPTPPLFSLSLSQMERSFCPKSKGLISSFTTPASSSSPVSFSPPSFTRIELLYGARPPRLRSRYNCRKAGFHTRIPRCSLQDSIVERYVAAIAAATAALAAIRLVYLYYVDRRSNDSSVEVCVFY
jgi:hypothetical protein